MFGSNELPLDFIKHQGIQGAMTECACHYFSRHIPKKNARDIIDNYVVKLFETNNWPKEKTIQIVDVAAGELLQTATIVTNLVNAGYKVEISIIDCKYTEDWQTSSDPNPETKSLPHLPFISDFKNLLTVLNSKSAQKNSAILNGVFSHVDSYLAALKGLSPLQYERVPQDQIADRVNAGAKRRYVSVDIGVVPPAERDKNARFFREFKQSSVCKNKLPDLVLLIDDISEFYPVGVGQPYKFYEANDVDLNYAYEEEVVSSIKSLNPLASFVATRKYSSGLELQVICQNQIIRNKFSPQPKDEEKSLMQLIAPDAKFVYPRFTIKSEKEREEVKAVELKAQHPMFVAAMNSYQALKTLIIDIESESLLKSENSAKKELWTQLCFQFWLTTEPFLNKTGEVNDPESALDALLQVLSTPTSELSKILLDSSTNNKTSFFSHSNAHQRIEMWCRENIPEFKSFKAQLAAYQSRLHPVRLRS